MSIKFISSTNFVSFKGTEKKSKEITSNTPEEIKNGKKKLILALAAVGAAAMAGVAIASQIRKGKEVDNKEAKAVVESSIKAVEEAANEGKKVVTEAISNTKISTAELEQLAKQDVSHIELYENGKLKTVSYIDGSHKRWYESGKPWGEDSVDGSTKMWLENGQIVSERSPKHYESGRSWYPNGQLKSEYDKYSQRDWYENGQPKRKLLNGRKNFLDQEWYENGQVAHINVDGDHKYFNQEGKEITVEEFRCLSDNPFSYL